MMSFSFPFVWGEEQIVQGIDSFVLGKGALHSAISKLPYFVGFHVSGILREDVRRH